MKHLPADVEESENEGASLMKQERKEPSLRTRVDHVLWVAPASVLLPAKETILSAIW